MHEPRKLILTTLSIFDLGSVLTHFNEFLSAGGDEVGK